MKHVFARNHWWKGRSNWIQSRTATETTEEYAKQRGQTKDTAKIAGEHLYSTNPIINFLFIIISWQRYCIQYSIETYC